MLVELNRSVPSESLDQLMFTTRPSVSVLWWLPLEYSESDMIIFTSSSSLVTVYDKTPELNESSETGSKGF